MRHNKHGTVDKINKTKQNKNKKASTKYKYPLIPNTNAFIQMYKSWGAMYHIVKDKSFSGKNPDHLPGIFYVRWERMDEKHTLLYFVFVHPILRGLRQLT
jgi:hypothetical protein